jgi:hypothetical protein
MNATLPPDKPEPIFVYGSYFTNCRRCNVTFSGREGQRICHECLDGTARKRAQSDAIITEHFNAITRLCQQGKADYDAACAKALKEAHQSVEGTPLAELARLSTQAVITELTERLHERTQGFLRTERKLRDELSLLKEILTGTLYSEKKRDEIVYTVTDGRVVGRYDCYLMAWDETLPYRGQAKLINGRPQL